MKKLKLILLLMICLCFSGCQSSHRIESASIIENVCVDSHDGQIYYTFFKLTDGDVPDGIEVPASSFKEACELAKRQYIPNLSLAKLELLMINKNIYTDILKTDIEYISTQSSFSPIAYFTLCDTSALKQVRENTAVQRLIEEQLRLCKDQNADVNIDYLSLFNSYSHKDNKTLLVPYVSYDREMKITTLKIDK